MSLLDLKDRLKQYLAQAASNPTLNKAAAGLNRAAQSGAMGPLTQALSTPKVRQFTIKPITKAARAGTEMIPAVQIARMGAKTQLTPQQQRQTIGEFGRGVGTLVLGPTGYATSFGLGAALSPKGQRMEGGYKGIELAQQYGGLAKATTPIISGAMSKIAPSLPQFTGRIGQGIANVAEGIVLDPLAGRKTDVSSMAFDFAMGALGKPFSINVKNAVKLQNEGRPPIRTPMDLLVSHEGAPDKARVEFYKKKILSGEGIDPLIIVKEGNKYGIEDGKHRFEALRQLGFTEAPAVFKKTQQYTKDAAGLFTGSTVKMGITGEQPPSVKGGVRPKEMGNAGYIDSKGTFYDVDSHQFDIYGTPNLRVVETPKELNIESSEKLLPEQITTIKRMFNKIKANNPNAKIIADTPSGSGTFKNIDELVSSPSVKGGVKVKPGMKERGFIKTVKEADVTPKPVKETLNAYYRPTTNKREVAAAETTLNLLGWDKAKSRVIQGNLDGNNSALGQLLAKKAFDSGRFEEGNEIIKAMSAKATRSGQGIQALSMWSKFTPEGMVKYAQSEIENANNTMPLLNRIMGTKKADWTPEDSKVITEMMKKVNLLPEGPNKVQATKDVFEYINKKLPWGVSDVLDEFRYNNMLSNPLTHLRNAVNNLQQALLVRPATLVAEGKPIEAVKYEIGALKSFPDAISAFKKSMKSGESFKKMDITEARVPKKLGEYNLPSTAMEAADKFFSALITGGEKARGSSAEKALQQAEYSLFRQDLSPGEQGYLLNRIDDVTRATYQLRKVGLGWFIPFIRTPMNVAKQWIEYSPAGLATIAGAGNKREQLGKALLGSIVTLIGAEMALNDRTTWATPTDPTQKKLFYDSGRKPYSVKIGDKWVPMQTFGVLAWALGLPAASKYYNDESSKALTDDKLTKLTKTALSGLGFWSGQTFVSGLGSFVKLAEGDADWTLAKNLAYTVGQLKPWSGFMRYVSTIMDPVYRKASGFKEQLMADVPGMTQNLQPYTNTFGEPSTRNLSNYIAPYSMGIANNRFEDMYQQRTVKLQSNALENQIKDEMEKSQGTPEAGGQSAVYTIDGANIEGKVVNGKFLYWDPETSTVKSPTVTALEKAQKKDEKGLVDAEYSLYSDRLKRADDTAGWRTLTNDYVSYLKEYREGLNRQEDAKEIITVTNKIEDLEAAVAKSKAVKMKKVSIKPVTISRRKTPQLRTVRVSIPKHPTISKPAVKAIKVTGNITKTPQYKIKTYKNTLTQGLIKLV